MRSTAATIFLLGCIALTGWTPVRDADAQIHRCRHPNGQTSYSDQPCESDGGTAAGQVQTAPAPATPARPAQASPPAKPAIPTELEASCRKLQLVIDETVLRVRRAQLDKAERMAEAARTQPPLSAQDRMALQRHLDEDIGQPRIYLRGLVHSPARAQCDRAGIRLELGPADRLKAQPSG